ncbi:hypothetical protein AB6A40_009895 [Gnathostoma spinigerum]|uniref:Uncharacterized protein n=1 Tax=Gnathostoma spinigerum TaxID=75299 RepID=A0ABD6F021_9BILA
MNSPLATETSTSTTVANPNNNVCCISTRTLAEHRSRSTTATTQTTTVNCSSAHCKRASPPRRCRNDLDVQGLVFSDNTRGKADEITCDFDELYRKFKQNKRDSTGTLNRLILVAQALESEVESHQRISISDSRIVLSIRTVNLVSLFTSFPIHRTDLRCTSNELNELR